MQDILGQESYWYPLSFMGLTQPFTALSLTTIFSTWLALLLLCVCIGIGRLYLARPDSVGGYIIRSIGKNFVDLVEQSVGRFVYRYYAFIGSLFLFILCCNWVALIPGISEPTKNLNTTLALGIISFLFTQKEIIVANGFLSYVKKYFMPFNVILPLNLLAGITLLPLKLLGELASIISISFRLFGNIFGGSIITEIYHHMLGKSLLLHLITMLSGLSLLLICFFILFEGFLQAFVFSILSLTNIAMAVQEETEVPV